MYDSSFFWTFTVATFRLFADGAFELFLVALGAAVIWRARGVLALRGLRWTGGGIVLYGVTGVLGALIWYVFALVDPSYRFAGELSVGAVQLVQLVLSAGGWIVDAACLVMIVLGATATLRVLATPAPAPEREATPADADDADLTDPRGLSVVNAK